MKRNAAFGYRSKVRFRAIRDSFVIGAIDGSHCFLVSSLVNELRDLLSSGGVLLPKGTKSSVLTEAANYIRLLQQHQYRSEM